MSIPIHVAAGWRWASVSGIAAAFTAAVGIVLLVLFYVLQVPHLTGTGQGWGTDPGASLGDANDVSGVVFEVLLLPLILLLWRVAGDPNSWRDRVIVGLGVASTSAAALAASGMIIHLLDEGIASGCIRGRLRAHRGLDRPGQLACSRRPHDAARAHASWHVGGCAVGFSVIGGDQLRRSAFVDGPHLHGVCRDPRCHRLPRHAHMDRLGSVCKRPANQRFHKRTRRGWIHPTRLTGGRSGAASGRQVDAL